MADGGCEVPDVHSEAINVEVDIHGRGLDPQPHPSKSLEQERPGHLDWGHSTSSGTNGHFLKQKALGFGGLLMAYGKKIFLRVARLLGHGDSALCGALTYSDASGSIIPLFISVASTSLSHSVIPWCVRGEGLDKTRTQEPHNKDSCILKHLVGILSQRARCLDGVGCGVGWRGVAWAWAWRVAKWHIATREPHTPTPQRRRTSSYNPSNARDR